jgi:uroporphyrin-3 C-methyltransferase
VTSSRGIAALALVVALAAVVLLAWQWHDERSRSDALRQELAKRLADADLQAREGRLIAEQVRAATADAQVKLGVLENRLAESQASRSRWKRSTRSLSRNRDEWAYAEIDQSLLLANQQLQLAATSRQLIALQSGRAPAAHGTPQFTALRKAINRDIERPGLRIDTVGISVRLDGLVVAVDAMPLGMEVRPPPQPAVTDADPQRAPWLQFWSEVWNDIKQLLRVQRLDNPDPPLLAPAQSYFLRENLKLRLIAARLALLARDETNYKADLKAAREWIGRYFDTGNEQVTHAIATLRTLHATEISIEVPDISGTLEALRHLRKAGERSAR